jgi:hypothetical protein
MRTDARTAAEALFGEGPPSELRGSVASKRTTAAHVLAALAQPAELFHAADGRAYATVETSGHSETWPVRSKRFKAWLGRAYYRTEKRPAPTQAMSEALALAEARAIDGPEIAGYVRVAESDGRVYVDLADDGWRFVEVDAGGWRVLDRAPVKFHRAAGMLALPEPRPGATLDALRAFVNVGDDDTWRLVVAWAVMALRPTGPYPVLASFGEQGSAKSTVTRVLRGLLDPNAAPLRSEPREPRDLMIAAEHGWVIALDNLSHLPPWLSDALCRLSSGGGFSTRELYTDSDEVIFSAMRPVILNGIEEIITRGDLMQRALIVELPVIAPEARRAEREFWQTFEAARPFLFGALLDAVSAALREAPGVRLPALPRMADFAQWSVAVERGLKWPSGGFLKAYTKNITDAHELVLDTAPVAHAVRTLVASSEWSGTVAELLSALAGHVDESTRRSRGWPATPKALSGVLRRLAPNLRAVGVGVTFLERTRRGRSVHLGVIGVGEQPSLPSPPSPAPGELPPAGVDGDAGDGRIPDLNACQDEGEL